VTHDLVLKNGLIVTSSGPINGAVAVAGERIVGVGADETIGSARQEIDLRGKIVMPGLFDPHVHFGISDTFGDDAMATDFQQDTRDCLVGGVTTVATTTLIGREPLPELFSRAIKCGEARSWCDFKITCVVNTLDQVKQIPAVARQGGVSYKFFTGYAGEQAEAFGMSREGISPGFFYEACRTIAAVGRPVFPMIHAEDPYVRGILVDELRRSGRRDYLTAWAETSPEWAESVQIYTYGAIANQLGCPLYPVHISAAQSVETIAALKTQGLPIVGETIAYFLSTTAPAMDLQGVGARGKIQPPIRFEKDRERLWRGIKEGTLSVVGTDSLTYSARFKESADFWDCRVGVNMQVADTLALLFDEAINRRGIDLVTLARVLSENAARMYGIYPRKGTIAVGSDADLVVVDQDKELTLGQRRTRGRSDYSLWEGRRVKGAPVMTFLRGRLVMENGEVIGDKGFGHPVEQTMKPRVA
jgi:dihydroorotase-like cyclic amidohydrolase